MSNSYTLEYDGSKRIEQSKSHFCQNCKNKLPFTLQKSTKYASMTCSGCSKTLRKSAEGKAEPDYASAIITILEKFSSEGIIMRITRAKDVQEKKGGAVKISRAVTGSYDAIQVNVYTTDVDDLDTFNPEAYVRDNCSNLSSAIDTLQSLDNYNVEYTFQDSEDDFVDIYAYIYHKNAPNPA